MKAQFQWRLKDGWKGHEQAVAGEGSVQGTAHFIQQQRASGNEINSVTSIQQQMQRAKLSIQAICTSESAESINISIRH